MPPRYLLDTDHCVAYTKVAHPAHQVVKRRVDSVSAAELRVAQFTVMELSEGPWHTETSFGYHDVRAAIHSFLSWIHMLEPTHLTIEEFGRIRAWLRKRGQLLDNMDLAIAATALSYDLTLVTHNTQHFARIPGLRLEDWYA